MTTPRTPRSGRAYLMSLRAYPPALSGQPQCCQLGYWAHSALVKYSGLQTSYSLNLEDNETKKKHVENFGRKEMSKNKI